ncbi:MAG: penicillin acylase family protein [Lysobacteraceae bacterium]
MVEQGLSINFVQRLYRIFRSHAVLSLFTAIVIVPVSFGLYQAHRSLAATLPESQGSRRLAGVHSDVRITRDESGVPSIAADNDRDAFFAMGYVHAQDRLWQMERQRRMAQGKLAEAFGKSAVPIDIYMRTLGLYRNAEISVGALSEPGRQSLVAYAAGVNAWLAEGHPLPVEFGLLGIKPQRWRPADSLAVVKLFALSLSGSYQQDLNRYLVAQKLPAEQYRILFGRPESLPQSSVAATSFRQTQMAALGEAYTEAETRWHVGGKQIGSNAWVVAAKYSPNGLATIANDPHMGLDMPSLWYPVDIHGARLRSSGMSLVGLPVVMLGRNEHVAWGVTNMMADTMDLYYEEVNEEDSTLYRRGDAWKKFDGHVETIQVKADFPAVLREALAPVKILVRRTDKGPVISDVTGITGEPLSLGWVGDSAQDTSYDGFFQLNYAGDSKAVRTAMRSVLSPALNLLYIDDQQNIGYLGVGKIPLRGRGEGMMPVPAWDESAGWRGFIPDDQMPRIFNPESGYIVSANNRMMAADYPYFVSGDFAQPERARRIEQLIREKIASGKPLSIKDHEAFQMDTLDLEAKAMLSELTAVKPDDDETARMLDYLRKWDGNASSESVGATIFYSTMRHLRSELLSEKLKGYWGNPRLQRRMNQIVTDMEPKSVRQALHDPAFDWCDRRDTPEHESCETIKLEALSDAAREMTRLLGSDMEDWQWSRAQKAIFRHTPFSDVKGLDFLFERRTPAVGSPSTVNLSGFSYSEKDGYVQMIGPAFRQIMQLGSASAPGQHWMMNSTGQSGNVMSEHYDDMVEKFAEGKYEAWPSASTTGRILILKPTAAAH